MKTFSEFLEESEILNEIRYKSKRSSTGSDDLERLYKKGATANKVELKMKPQGYVLLLNDEVIYTLEDFANDYVVTGADKRELKKLLVKPPKKITDLMDTMPVKQHRDLLLQKFEQLKKIFLK